MTLHETRYGKTSNEEAYIVGPNAFSTSQFLHFDNAARYLADLEVRYDVTKSFQVALGAQNLFDVRPNTLLYEAQLEGAHYDDGSTIGFNGGFYYLRARYVF